VIDSAYTDFDFRVLVLGPGRKDAEFTRAVLGEVGIHCVACPSLDVLLAELDRGAGAVIVTEEAILRGGRGRLKEALDRQLPWSDLPLIVVVPAGADLLGGAEAIADLGSVSLLEQPVRLPALMGAVRTALRARSRQYQLRAHLREREQTAEALKEADRRKDEFLAILAHELRNPLAPMLNALNVMRLAGADGGASAGMADMLERQVTHMVRLVDDLFEASRLARGNIAVRPERLDLCGVIRHSLDTSRPLFDAARQVLEVELGSEPLWVDGDPIRLAQVFSNLLNNASKFSDEGGLIRLTARVRADSVEVSVRDHGAGIRPEMLSRVFDMFAQGTRSAKKIPGGLGIGLTLARRLVELHGGRVEAQSDGPGRGCEFTVRLPLAERKSREDARTSRAQVGGSLPPQRILVVDDNRDSAESVAVLLELLGADVHMAYDGPSALAAIDDYRPDVVLMDIGLPGMDGYEVARRIRQRAELDRLTLIAITGWGQEEDRRRSRTAGFQHHLVKPADPVALQALLTSLDAERHGSTH
jgi:signal transduction histidine kinase/ActR/RegA family two-component response regulator